MTASHRDDLAPATALVTAGRPARTAGAPVNPPIILSSTFVSQGTPTGHVYQRMDTPAWHPVEELLAQLEAAEEPAVIFASGMAAIAASFSLVPRHRPLVLPHSAYNTTLSLAASLAEAGDVILRVIPPGDEEAVADAVRGTGRWRSDGGGPAAMVWVETPSNPLLDIVDIAAIAAVTRPAGALLVVDNTFATPLGQQPLTLGADLVVHSATKYIAGHSDLLLGAAISSSAELTARLRTHRTRTGAVASPFDAWLALRGMRTLALRVERANASAAELARRLTGHPQVAWVRYPGLPDHPGHQVASAQMTGFGAIVSFAPVGDGALSADAFVQALRLWLPATSLGGVESMVERRRRHANEPTSVPTDLIRASVGIEDVEDLWRDLEQAFDAIR